MTLYSGFARSCRLTKTDEFSSVFVFKCSARGNFLHLMAKPNGLAHARLGVVVGKRVAKRANARNYMKRVVRECFRLSQHDMVGLDMIARVHKPFIKDNFAEVSAELHSLFLGIKKCLVRSSS